MEFKGSGPYLSRAYYPPFVASPTFPARLSSELEGTRVELFLASRVALEVFDPSPS